MKYPQSRGRLLETICSHGAGINIYSWVTITPRKCHVDSLRVALLPVLQNVYSQTKEYQKSWSQTMAHIRTAKAYKEFSKEWGVQHITLSPT